MTSTLSLIAGEKTKTGRNIQSIFSLRLPTMTANNKISQMIFCAAD
jgi:hypothetical protein